MSRQPGAAPELSADPIIRSEDLFRMQKETEAVYLSREMSRYLVALANATRTSEDLRLGASPRATLALAAMSRAAAYLEGRDYVVPQDTVSVFLDVMTHRVKLSAKARISGKTSLMCWLSFCAVCRSPLCIGNGYVELALVLPRSAFGRGIVFVFFQGYLSFFVLLFLLALPVVSLLWLLASFRLTEVSVSASCSAAEKKEPLSLRCVRGAVVCFRSPVCVFPSRLPMRWEAKRSRNGWYFLFSAARL